MLKLYQLMLLAALLPLCVLTSESAFPQTAAGTTHVCTLPLPEDFDGPDVFSVGEVRTSILQQGEFQERNGREWVLMNGKPIPRMIEIAPYVAHLDYRLPDAQGRFLRMHHNGFCSRSFPQDSQAYKDCIDSRDPSETEGRQLGKFQQNQNRSHQHDYRDVYTTSMRAGEGNQSFPGRNRSGQENRAHEKISLVDIEGDGKPSNSLHFEWPGGDRAWWDDRTEGVAITWTSRESGGTESRPNNIAVNFFIKACRCRTAECR